MRPMLIACALALLYFCLNINQPTNLNSSGFDWNDDNRLGGFFGFTQQIILLSYRQDNGVKSAKNEGEKSFSKQGKGKAGIRKRAKVGDRSPDICAQNNTPFIARSLGVLFCILFYIASFILITYYHIQSVLHAK
jgi:hypothetical protein